MKIASFKLNWLSIVLALVVTSACVSLGSNSRGMKQKEQGSNLFLGHGEASVYSRNLHAHPTASGEIFSKNRLTAAHRSLPFGTLVRVVNSSNGREVIVRINDRGPFVVGRLIDLSPAAAQKLGISVSGVASVDLYRSEAVVNNNVRLDHATNKGS